MSDNVYLILLMVAVMVVVVVPIISYLARLRKETKYYERLIDEWRELDQKGGKRDE